MFAFALRRVGFAPGRRSRGQMPVIAPSPSGVAVLHATGLQPCLRLDKHRLCAPPDGIRRHDPTQMGNGMPSPPRGRVGLPETPPLIARPSTVIASGHPPATPLVLTWDSPAALLSLAPHGIGPAV